MCFHSKGQMDAWLCFFPFLLVGSLDFFLFCHYESFWLNWTVIICISVLGLRVTSMFEAHHHLRSWHISLRLALTSEHTNRATNPWEFYSFLSLIRADFCIECVVGSLYRWALDWGHYGQILGWAKVCYVDSASSLVNFGKLGVVFRRESLSICYWGDSYSNSSTP